MRFTRRRFLAASAALLPARVWSASEIDLGGRSLVTLSDGFLELPPDFIFGLMPPAEAAAVMAAHNLGPGPLIAPCNVALLRDGTNTVLFDVGAGPDFMATAGRLPEAMAVLGLAPEAVTHVVFTHAHPDHLWGLLDDFGDPAFPEAALYMGGAEHAYWTDPATAETIGPARTTFAVGAARRLAAVADLLTLLEPGDTPVPGVTARLTPGHTPGHMAFDLGEVLLVGDAIANPHVAFASPDMPSGSDQDPALAAETRVGLLTDLAASGQGMVGFHLPDGGIGRVVVDGGAYRFDAG